MSLYGNVFKPQTVELNEEQIAWIDEIEADMMTEAAELGLLDESQKFKLAPKFKDKPEYKELYKTLQYAENILNQEGIQLDGNKAGKAALEVLDKVNNVAQAGSIASMAVPAFGIPAYLITRVVSWGLKNGKENIAQDYADRVIAQLDNLKDLVDDEATLEKIQDTIDKLEQQKANLDRDFKQEKKNLKVAKRMDKKDAKIERKAEKKALRAAKRSVKRNKVDDNDDDEMIDDINSDTDDDDIEESYITKEENNMNNETVLEAVLDFLAESDRPYNYESLDDVVDHLTDLYENNIISPEDAAICMESLNMISESNKAVDTTSVLEYCVENGIQLDSDQLAILKEADDPVEVLSEFGFNKSKQSPEYQQKVEDWKKNEKMKKMVDKINQKDVDKFIKEKNKWNAKDPSTLKAKDTNMAKRLIDADKAEKRAQSAYIRKWKKTPEYDEFVNNLHRAAADNALIDYKNKAAGGYRA